MIWLFCNYLMIIVIIWVTWWNNVQGELLTQYCIRQAMLPQNTGGYAASKYSECNLWLLDSSLQRVSRAFPCAWCIQVESSVTRCVRGNIRRACQQRESGETPHPQGRTRFLTKSWIGASKLASAKEALASYRRNQEAPVSSSPATPFRCWQWESYECEDANSPLQLLHLKFKSRSVCLLCIRFHSCCQDFIIFESNFDKTVQFHSSWQDCPTKCFERTETVVEGQSENKKIQVYQVCNVILQRREYSASSETSKSATKQRSRGGV